MTIRGVKHFLVGVHIFCFNRNVCLGMDKWHRPIPVCLLPLETAHLYQITFKSLGKHSWLKYMVSH